MRGEMFQCNPALHNQKKIPADYFIRAVNNLDGGRTFEPTPGDLIAHASCQQHLMVGIEDVFDRGGEYVVVERLAHE